MRRYFVGLGTVETDDMVDVDGFNVKDMAPFRPGAHPYNEDAYHMGAEVTPDVEAMYDSKGQYCVLVHKPTGKRILVVFPE